MAAIRSGAARPERTVIANFGPMPLTETSFSNSIFSSAVAKPNKARASSRTCVWMRSRTSRPASGKRGERRDRNRHIITDAASLDDRLVRMLFEQRSTQMSNHVGERYIISQGETWRGAGFL